eukprot:CAMPEP_0114980604 /NCGR_PEP_ID=MMETSP0216-20121206/5063_1 /TAXON_ID=223996 /ORGANISM="Protocruzia adherens, Strain Boccale" /LENGTH=63 /DNA_ID=CAMNT_0002342147 /DNA_START=1 /DNA_END=189 /DNA_ORIENTATION=+
MVRMKDQDIIEQLHPQFKKEKIKDHVYQGIRSRKIGGGDDPSRGDLTNSTLRLSTENLDAKTP